MLVAIVIGIPVGVLAAVRRRSFLDVFTMSAVLVGVSIPVFWLGWMLVYVLAVLPSRFGLDLFPISGRISLLYDIPPRTHLIVIDALLAGNGRAALDALWHLVLPALTLGTIPLAIVAKITRGSMLEVLASDYVRTARAKGLSERTVVVRHALRNALIPIITVLGLQTGLLLGGAVLTESVFAWPGVGRLGVRRDLQPRYAGYQRLRAALRHGLRDREHHRRFALRFGQSPDSLRRLEGNSYQFCEKR